MFLAIAYSNYETESKLHPVFYSVANKEGSYVILQEVSRRLGHADVKMTWNTYAHLYPNAEDSALKALEKS